MVSGDNCQGVKYGMGIALTSIKLKLEDTMKEPKCLKLVSRQMDHEKDTYQVNVKGIIRTDAGGYAIVVEIPFRKRDTAYAVAAQIIG